MNGVTMRQLFLIILMCATMASEAQQTVTFQAADGLTVTADLYLQDKSYPFIILYHQANFSRGEYKETAPKLLKLKYNCLAVDLRSGKEVNFIQNQTAALAREKKLPCDYIDALPDMLAAIGYVKQYNDKKIILFGSSYSASLVLKIAANNPKVKAVIAFSPGEYFGTNLSIHDSIAGKLDKPLFIASTKSEYPFVKEMLSGVAANNIMYFTPSKSAGIHGSRALWASSTENEACWMQLLLFFNGLKK